MICYACILSFSAFFLKSTYFFSENTTICMSNILDPNVLSGLAWVQTFICDKSRLDELAYLCSLTVDTCKTLKYISAHMTILESNINNTAYMKSIFVI